MDIRIREKNGFLYTSFFTTSDEGKPISEIKKDPEMAVLFAENLADHLPAAGDRQLRSRWEGLLQDK